MIDGFVKKAAGVTLALLAFILVNAYVGARTGKDLGGLDDRVETMAIQAHGRQPRPLLELPGDSEVGAFTVAAFGMGMIVGYSWRKLFGEGAAVPESEEAAGRAPEDEQVSRGARSADAAPGEA